MLAVGVAGPAAWYLVPQSKYRAQATLQVVAQSPQILFKVIESQGNGGEEYKRYQKTQVNLVKSRLVLNAALQQEGVARYALIRSEPDPPKYLQEKLEVGFVGESELMEIALSGDDPKELAGLVNAIKKAYMDEVVDVELKGRTARYDHLTKLEKEYNDLLKGRRETLRKLAETVGSDNRTTLAMKQQYALESVASIRNELLEVQSKKRRLEAQLKAQVSGDEPLTLTSGRRISPRDIDRMIDEDPAVLNMMDQLAELQQKLSVETIHARQVVRRPGSEPVIKSLRSQVDGAQKALARMRQEARPGAIRKLQELEHSGQQTQKDEGQQELAMLDVLERQLDDEIKHLSDGNQTLTVQTLDLQDKQDEIAKLQEAASKIGSEVEALRVELKAPPRIRVLEDAVVPRTRDDKKRYMMIGLITLGSFFGSLLGIAFLELRTLKVDTMEAVSGILGLQVVGSLPVLPSRVRSGRAIARNSKDRIWHNLLLESIDAVRTMLVHAARTSSYRIVMIASAEAGEGKTSLASHLATSLGRCGHTTLLIDADFRNPSIHRLFDLPSEPGLAEVLRAEIETEAAISATPIEELKVLAAGRCDERLIRLLARGDLGAVFARLKDQFDFVIVDTSPILPVADALIVAQQSDAVLFSIFQERSHQAKVLSALHRLQTLGIDVLGAVVMGGEGSPYGTDYYRDSLQAVDPSPSKA